MIIIIYSTVLVRVLSVIKINDCSQSWTNCNSCLVRREKVTISTDQKIALQLVSLILPLDPLFFCGFGGRLQYNTVPLFLLRIDTVMFFFSSSSSSPLNNPQKRGEKSWYFFFFFLVVVAVYNLIMLDGGSLVLLDQWVYTVICGLCILRKRVVQASVGVAVV